MRQCIFSSSWSKNNASTQSQHFKYPRKQAVSPQELGHWHLLYLLNKATHVTLTMMQQQMGNLSLPPRFVSLLIANYASNWEWFIESSLSTETAVHYLSFPNGVCFCVTVFGPGGATASTYSHTVHCSKLAFTHFSHLLKRTHPWTQLLIRGFRNYCTWSPAQVSLAFCGAVIFTDLRLNV